MNPVEPLGFDPGYDPSQFQPQGRFPLPSYEHDPYDYYGRSDEPLYIIRDSDEEDERGLDGRRLASQRSRRRY